MDKDTLNRLARLGAVARLAELRAEIAGIVRAFPGLTAGTAASRRRVGRPKGVRKRRKLSAEARERIAAAQRARWAKVRAAKKARS